MEGEACREPELVEDGVLVDVEERAIVRGHPDADASVNSTPAPPPGCKAKRFDCRWLVHGPAGPFTPTPR
jgi:hypothetical protein